MKTVWTKLALQDLLHVRDYISADHPVAAVAILQKIGKAVENLNSCQNLGPHKTADCFYL